MATQYLIASLNRRITGNPNDVETAFKHLALDDKSHMAAAILPNHSILDSTRYVRDFDEVGVIGKGGYGTVFHVQHKLDGLSYAVKKIPLGPNQLHEIQQKGQMELDAILSELRTLAKLEHPNIVRYYNGWIEWSTAQTPPIPTFNRRQTLIEGPDAIAGAADEGVDVIFSDGSANQDHDQEPSLSVSGAEPSLVFQDDQGIIFDNSISTDTRSATSKSAIDAQALGGAELERVKTRSTIASVSDEDVEYIARDITTSFTDQRSSTDARDTGVLAPRLTLHIQMSLYTTTLTRYLSPDPIVESSTTLTLRHCFHLHGAIQILLAIIDGVEYLHSEGIVHRDLKPGNIFMGARLSPSNRMPAGSVNPFACTPCQKEAGVPESPVSLSVCIGDFGLVSKIQSERERQTSTPSRAVGTELYRPETSNRGVHPSLDIYALGVIFFELLWPFTTRMERLDTLHRLKRHGEFPTEFVSKVGHPNVETLISEMLFDQSENGLSCMTLKPRLLSMVEKCCNNEP